jgi:hypothetical protein
VQVKGNKIGLIMSDLFYASSSLYASRLRV